MFLFQLPISFQVPFDVLIFLQHCFSLAWIKIIHACMHGHDDPWHALGWIDHGTSSSHHFYLMHTYMHTYVRTYVQKQKQITNISHWMKCFCRPSFMILWFYFKPMKSLQNPLILLTYYWSIKPKCISPFFFKLIYYWAFHHSWNLLQHFSAHFCWIQRSQHCFAWIQQTYFYKTVINFFMFCMYICMSIYMDDSNIYAACNVCMYVYVHIYIW